MVSGFSGAARWVGLGDSVVAAVLLPLLGLVLGVAATTVLFFAMYRLLAQPGGPAALVEGAVLGAVGFEVLKYLAGFLMAGTKNEPAAQALGVALVLLVWINYFSRVTMYGAAYYAAPEAERRRAERPRSPRSRWSRSAPPPYRWAGRRTAVAARCSRE